MFYEGILLICVFIRLIVKKYKMRVNRGYKNTRLLTSSL